jgi:hypothetical protein
MGVAKGVTSSGSVVLLHPLMAANAVKLVARKAVR